MMWETKRKMKFFNLLITSINEIRYKKENYFRSTKPKSFNKRAKIEITMSK